MRAQHGTGQAHDADGDQLHRLGIVINHEDFERLAPQERQQPNLNERLRQLVSGHGLLHDRRGAEREAPVAIRHDRNDHDRDVHECWHLLDATEKFPAVHVGQHDVQGDQR